MSSRFDRFQFAEEWVRRSKKEGRVHGAELLALPPSQWAFEMAKDSRYRTYGTIEFMIDRAHEDLNVSPRNAVELTGAFLNWIDEVEAPEKALCDLLRGRAWRERANALYATGDFKGALDAVLRAVAILKARPGHAYDECVARLVQAMILRETGEYNEALTLARSCADAFWTGNAAYYNKARTVEALILFTVKQFEPAMAILVELVSEAETRGDKLALAMALHNTGNCAKEIGDTGAAKEFFARALSYYEELGQTANIPRIRWSYALASAADGKLHEAIWELAKVRREYLRLGANSDAALAALASVRIKLECNENVLSDCTELVKVFTDAGMTQNAIEALAYIREQSRTGELTIPEVKRVEQFVRDLRGNPTQVFLTLPEGHDG
jgi:tetratricopeptide (TPR) repeat protein